MISRTVWPAAMTVLRLPTLARSAWGKNTVMLGIVVGESTMISLHLSVSTTLFFQPSRAGRCRHTHFLRYGELQRSSLSSINDSARENFSYLAHYVHLYYMYYNEWTGQGRGLGYNSLPIFR